MPQSPITDPLSWRAMTAPSLVDFEILANEVYSGLPKEFRTLCADLVIRIEDFATNEILERRASAENLAVSLRLGRLSVRRQQSEIVLGVLVVVLRRNDVARDIARSFFGRFETRATGGGRYSVSTALGEQQVIPPVGVGACS
jgi:hypothetical protein